MSEPILKLEAIEAGYGEMQVLWGLDLEIHEGEVVALVGANGAGKTTTLRVASGVLRPWAGRVWLGGRDVTHLSPAQRVALGVSHVPEGRKLFAGMTVHENLRMGAFLRRDGARAVEEDLQWVYHLFPSLAKRRDALAGTLSGGEQQMCAIGRGLMARPRVLLVDEMSLGLAPVVVDRLIEVITQVRRERHLSILVVEQDLNVALGIADRGYVLDTGRLVRSGASAALLADPTIRSTYLGI